MFLGLHLVKCLNNLIIFDGPVWEIVGFLCLRRGLSYFKGLFEVLISICLTVVLWLTNLLGDTDFYFL